MDEQTALTKGQLIEQQSAEERKAFAAFKQKYMQQVPPPSVPAVLNLKNLGFEFWMYFVMSLSAIALAAMRTWEAFYRVGLGTTSNQGYATLEAWLAVAVIEVGLVVFAAALARKRYVKQEQARMEQALAEGKRFRHSKDVDANSVMLVFGLILMVFISMNAGLDQSVRIIKNVSQDFLQILSYVLGISIGLGVSIIAFIGGEILGQQVAIVTADFSDRAADYGDAMDEYQEELEQSWAHSDERRFIRAEVRQAAKQSGSEKFDYGSVTNNFRTNGELRRPPKQTERVFQYMDQIYQTEQRIPSFSEVMEVLEIAKATASESRSKWLEERGLNE